MPFNHRAALPNSLMSWLRIANSPISNYSANTLTTSSTLSKTMPKFLSVNADTYLGYWDIVRNYYSYSSWGVFSFAHPGTYRPAFLLLGPLLCRRLSIVRKLLILAALWQLGVLGSLFRDDVLSEG